jgi:hypothetical protein
MQWSVVMVQYPVFCLPVTADCSSIFILHGIFPCQFLPFPEITEILKEQQFSATAKVPVQAAMTAFMINTCRTVFNNMFDGKSARYQKGDILKDACCKRR